MIIVASAAIGIAAHAANVTWGLANVTAQGSATPEGYVAYFLMSSDTSGAAAAKVWSVEDATAAASAKDASAFTSHSLTASKALDDEGSARSAKLTTYASSWVSPETGDFYAVVFNAESISEATHYLIVAPTRVSFGTATANQTASLNASSATWTAVPEPTSGLMLLLGVAGLALRRKRA